MMKPCFRAYFLILFAAVAMHLPLLHIVALLVGYLAFESLDAWVANRARDKKFDEALAFEIDWSPDPDDPDYEIKGNLTRRRLSGSDQIVVTRLTEFLWSAR
jgi:hypothetical protein